MVADINVTLTEASDTPVGEKRGVCVCVCVWRSEERRGGEGVKRGVCVWRGEERRGGGDL